MNPGAWVLLIALAATLGIGLWWRARQGIPRSSRVGSRVSSSASNSARNGNSEDGVVDQFPDELRQRLAEQPDEGIRVTLLQLSSTFCTPCRHTRILLAAFAERTNGVRHVEVDLTHHPAWSTPLRVHTTPTTLVLDESGRELFRISGVPKRDALTKALDPHLHSE